jgi:hypothetical protein
VFEVIYNSYKNNFDDNTGWKYYAEKFGFQSAEACRSSFKRTRKAKGFPSKNDIVLENSETNKPAFNSKYKMPIVGVVDIETLPAVVYTFRIYDQNIGIDQIISDICLLSWAGKFLNESEIFSDILTPEEAPLKSDERIVKSCWEFLSKCDYVIGHNWNSFDGRILNTMFLQYGLPPIKYIAIDTYLVAKQSFRFTSSSLKFINQKLGIRDKISNEGILLWAACHRGEKKSLDEMMAYNIGDIMSTEQLFYRVQPYVKNLNVALFNEINEYQCPVCGSTNLKEEGFYWTSAGKWQSLRCSDCGCVSRKKQNLLDKEKKKSLLINS